MASVQVIPRFRPLNSREQSENGGKNVIVSFEPDGKAFTITDPQTQKPIRFTFDHVLGPDTTQEHAFRVSAEPLLSEVMKGFNVTVFSYGQTGTGKTHSMVGNMYDADLKGIIPRLVEGIFALIANADNSIEFTVKVSYVEIYNEKIRDLMAIEKDNLKIRESAAGVWIEDVTQVYVRDCAEVYTVMSDGNKNRSVAATKMNAESSRSHSVFLITVGQKDTSTGTIKGAKLTLVDLAGSEKVGKTGADGQTLKEAQHINKSLSALGNVINALTSAPVKGQKLHIPYRDSKLTYLLSDSLGGNSKTTLIITGSPSAYNVEETIGTMRFGNRAKSIKNKPKMNQERSVAEYQRLLNAANAKVSLLENSQKLYEQESGVLRLVCAMQDPNFNNLFNKKKVIDMITTIIVRNSVAKVAKNSQGHPGWSEYYNENAANDMETLQNSLTIEDIMNSMEMDASEQASNGEEEEHVRFEENPEEEDKLAISVQPTVIMTKSTTTESKLVEEQKEEVEESPFGNGYSSSDEEEADKKSSANQSEDEYAHVQSSYGKKSNRESSATFAMKSKELLEANAMLELEVETLKEQISELKAEQMQKDLSSTERVSVLSKLVEEVQQEKTKLEGQHKIILAIETQRMQNSLFEVKREVESLSTSKMDLEHQLDGKVKQFKLYNSQMKEIQEKMEKLETANNKREQLLERIKQQHGESILQELETADMKVDLDVVKATQDEVKQLREDLNKSHRLLGSYKASILSLTSGFQGKCKVYNQSQLTLSAAKTHIEDLESALLESQEKYQSLSESKKVELQHVENQLVAVQTMVEQLYESGKYWKGLSKYNYGPRIVVPVVGGGKTIKKDSTPTTAISGSGRPRAHSVKTNGGGSMDQFF